MIASPGFRFRSDTPPPPIHTPERSGVPLARRGAGDAGFAAGLGAWAAAGADKTIRTPQPTPRQS